MFVRLDSYVPKAPPLTVPSPFTVSSAISSCEGGDRCGDMVAHRILEDGTLALVVVDVAGRGNAWGSLSYYVAMNLLGLLVMQCQLERAVKTAEYDFRREIAAESAQFVTVFAALLDANRHCLRYTSAGHDTALLLSHDRSHRHLSVTGPAFGLPANPLYRSASVGFSPGDLLVVVTDGVTAARNDRGVPFGSNGVLRAAVRARSTGKDPAQALIDEASQHEVERLDDRAAVIVGSVAC